MKINNSFVILIVFCLSPAFLFAQKDTSLIKLDEVIISEGRIDQAINKIAGSISVLNKNDFGALQMNSIDNALQNTPGININRPLGIYGSSNVSIRGLGGAEQGRILVLLDGVPINKSDLGGVNWNRINPLSVSKIEVMKGPGSSFFGKNAMGGVINIITQDYGKKTISGSINLSYGTYNTYSVNTEVSAIPFQKEKFKLRLNTFYRKSDGYISQPDSLRDSTNIAAWSEEFGIDISESYDFNKRNNINFSYNFYNDKRSQGIKIFDKTGNTTDHDTHFLRSRYKGKKNNFSWNTNIYFQYEKYLRVVEKIKKGNYSMYNVTSGRKDLGFSGNIFYKTKKNKISAGFDLKKGIVNGADEYQTSEDIVKNIGDINNYSVFFNDNFQFAKNLFLNATLHYDYTFLNKAEFKLENTTSTSDFLLSYESEQYNRSQDAVSPKFSLLFLKGFFKFYLSYSSGFRTPTLDDLSRTGFIAGGFKIANSELKAEKINNIEFGTTFTKNKTKINFSTYYSKGNDFMYYTETGDLIFGKKPILIKKNITEIQMYGVETSFNYSVNKYLNTYINYAFTKNKILKFKGKEELNGKSLTYSPENNLQIGFILRTNSLIFSTSFNYISEQYLDNLNTISIPEQYLVNLKISKNINTRFNLFFSIRNVLNNRYLIYYDQESIGRFVNFGLGFRF